MNIERMISEYENELASLKKTLRIVEDPSRKLEVAAEITEIEEIIADLKRESK